MPVPAVSMLCCFSKKAQPSPCPIPARPRLLPLARPSCVIYHSGMQAVVTAEFLEVIPVPIRQRLRLHAGDVLDFDEQAPFLKAVPAEPVNETESSEFADWLNGSVGLARGKF